jgi:CHASE2 domain-containing sensor protein
MNKSLVLFWPFLAAIGAIFVVLFDQGSGLDSPGIWLVPAGVLGIIVTSIKNGKAKRLKSIGIVWLLALISILGLYYSWFTEGFDGFIWILPAAGFTLVGIVLLFIEAFRNLRQ